MQLVPSGARRRCVRAGDSELDLARLVRALWRKKWRDPVPDVCCRCCATFVVVNMITPQYKSEAESLIEVRENVFLRPDAEKTVDRRSTSTRKRSPARCRSSCRATSRARSSASSISRERPEFDPVLKGVSLLGAFLRSFGLGSDPLKMTPEERVLRSLFRPADGPAVERSRVIT